MSQLPHGGEFGLGLEDSLRHHRQYEFSLLGVAPIEQGREFQTAKHLQDDFDMTVCFGRFDGKGFVGMYQRFVFEQSSESLNFFRRPFGKIGDGAFADACAFSPGFSEQIGGRRVAIWDFVDIHGY